MKNKILLLTAIFAAGLIASATAAARGNGQGRGRNADGTCPYGTPENCPNYAAGGQGRGNCGQNNPNCTPKRDGTGGPQQNPNRTPKKDGTGGPGKPANPQGPQDGSGPGPRK
jgi:opacity protein-like surface antigen